MSSVSSIMLYSNEAESNNTCISLPQLFKQPLVNIRHGIILKNGDDDENKKIENRIILLTTQIECEAEIAHDEIYPLPEIFGCMRFSTLFSGILFSSGQRGEQSSSEVSDYPVLLLNPGQLVQNIQGEFAND